MNAPDLRGLADRWQWLCSGPADGVTNMATDLALMAGARRTGVATLRVYTWDRPTLSLGRHERARDRFSPERIASAGVGLVRRPTGGRALLHHRELTYSVTAPADSLSLSESYAAINALLLDGLRTLGVHAEAAQPTRRPLRPDGAACFAEPAHGELIVDGAKLVGSAQLREHGALLQHGSILLADDQGLIETLRVDPATSAATNTATNAATNAATGVGTSHLPATLPAATLQTLLGRAVTSTEVARALSDALQRAIGASLESAPVIDASLQDDLARLVIAYADPAWTWRR